MFWKKKYRELTQEEIEIDLHDRQVDKYKLTLLLVNGEVVEYTTKWRRFKCYLNGINSYKKLLLLDKDLTINNITYNTRNIVKIEHTHVSTTYIKSEIKRKLKTGGTFCEWRWKRVAEDSELEII